MPTIRYKSRNARQTQARGRGAAGPIARASHDAPPARGAIRRSTEGGKLNRFLTGKKIRRQEILFLTRQLFTMHKAGVPIAESLGSMASHETHPALRGVLTDMKRDVEEGISLTEAMRKHPKVFSHFYTGVVEGGEQNGVLSALLEKLARYMENEERVARSIKSALRYPFFVLITLSLAFVMIMTFIFPRFKPLFAKFGDDLPYQTKILLIISSTLQHRWYFLLAGAVILVALFLVAKRFRSFRRLIDILKIRLPVSGTLYRYAAISQFANMFATFLAGGIIDFLNMLHLIERAFTNTVIRDEIRRLGTDVTNGKSLGESMETTGLFTPLFAHLTLVGEKTGGMESMMHILYDYYEQEVCYKTQKLISTIEPLILLVTSGFIVFIALGIFMPDWRLMEVCR